MNTGWCRKKILLMADSSEYIIRLLDRLGREGYAVSFTGDRDVAKSIVRNTQFDLILLDRQLTSEAKATFFEECSNGECETPVISLYDNGQSPKPWPELLTEIGVVFCDSTASRMVAVSESYSFGPFFVDFRGMMVSRNGEKMELSSREFQLLRFFIENRGAVLSREVLLQHVWGYQSVPATRTIDVHITLLRQKLEDNTRLPKYILTVHGYGYKFVG